MRGSGPSQVLLKLREDEPMMTRIIAAIGLSLALCATASADQFFSASLDGLQESPPVATPGSGTGSAVFHPDTNMLDVSVSFSGLIGTTSDAHIHCCFMDPPGRNIGVAVGLSPHGFPLGVTSGLLNASIDLLNPANYTATFLNNFGGGTAAGARDALLAGMSQLPGSSKGAYFNIHTTHRPGGEIRGDIFVPEPASLLLVLCGLAAVPFGRRARR